MKFFGIGRVRILEVSLRMVCVIKKGCWKVMEVWVGVWCLFDLDLGKGCLLFCICLDRDGILDLIFWDGRGG